MLGILAATPAAGEVSAVSPGERGREVEAASACPTFSWSAEAGSSGYELAVFRLDGSEEPTLVFTKRVEASATSWSPSRGECLAPGGRFGWTVRALGADLRVGSGAWAEPLRFRVPGAPSEEEFAAALAVVRRWARARGDEEPFAHDRNAAHRAPTTPAAGGTVAAAESEAAEALAATGVAAIRGENPDTSGSALGLLGISHSPGGAGVVARNESAGADLVLDGEANGAADTLLRQDSLDRPSANAEIFDFRNSGAGTLTLKIDGLDVVTSATDQDTLGALSCPAGRVAKVDAGGDWACAGDDDSLSALACADGEIAKRVTGAWACAADDTGAAGIWSSYAEGTDVRVFNGEGNRVAVGNRAIQPVGSLPSEDGALTISHRAPLPLTTQYNLTLDGRGIQTRLVPGLFQPQQDAPLWLNRYGGGISIGKDTPPTRAALEAQGSVGNTMALFQPAAGGQGLALVGDWPGIYANSYLDGLVKTMSASGFSQAINFDQHSGSISFMTSSEPNGAADVPASSLSQRLRLDSVGALWSSLSLSQFNLAPLAVLSLRYLFDSDGQGNLVATRLDELVASEYPVDLTPEVVNSVYGAVVVTLHVNGYRELVPVLGTSSGVGRFGQHYQVTNVRRAGPTSFRVEIFDPVSVVGMEWSVQVIVYGLT